MSWYDAASGTKTTAGTTEEQLVDLNWPGRYALSLDLNALTVVSGTPDIYTLRLKRNVLDAGTERLHEQYPVEFVGGTLIGAIWESQPFTITDTGEVTIQRSQGATDRAIPWRLRRVGGFPALVVSDAGNSATTFKTDLTESATDYHKRRLLRFLDGSLKDQIAEVSAYNGSTKFVTVSGGYTSTPTAGDAFELIG